MLNFSLFDPGWVRSSVCNAKNDKKQLKLFKMYLFGCVNLSAYLDVNSVIYVIMNFLSLPFIF